MSDPMSDPTSALLAENQRAWDLRTPVHLASPMYDLEGWRRGETSLTPLELDWLGDVGGKSVLHLQCHFGQDTLSIARLGAHVAGVDFSGEAIGAARGLAAELGLPASFTQADVLQVRLGTRHDVVFTSWGALGWLPSLEPWARTVAAHLAPGGRLVLAEFHPYVWMSQSGPDLQVRYSYFNRGPISEETSGTYADPHAPIRYREHGWNHPTADLLTALLRAGLRITRFEELDHVFHDVFPGLEPRPGGGYWFSEAKGMLPLAFALEARLG